MFNSKNAISKYVGYFLVGFFLLIIIFSFGMPDLGLNCGSDPTSIAVVNGQKIHHLDFLRYRDTKFRQYKDKNMTPWILDRYIMETLMVQKAEENGFDTTDEKISRYIKNEKYFQNPDTKKFDPQIFQIVLKNNRISFIEYSKNIKRAMKLRDFSSMISDGAAIATEDIKSKYIVDNSKIKIKYAHLKQEELRKRFIKDLYVSEKEINEEINNNNVTVKDPKTDRARIKKELEDKKLEEIKKDLIKKINVIAAQKGSFASAASILKGKTEITNTFKIGEKITIAKKKNETIPAIENSKIFRNTCLSMEENSASEVIESTQGLYIFTPILKSIPHITTVKEDEFKSIKDSIAYSTMRTLDQNLAKSLNEKSKITKNLKLN